MKNFIYCNSVAAILITGREHGLGDRDTLGLINHYDGTTCECDIIKKIE